MNLFVHEFITGGGTWGTPGIDLAGSLLAEGSAMARAVLADFSAIARTRVHSTLDARLCGKLTLPGEVTVVASAEEEQAAFEHLVRQADLTLLIAPEIGGLLHERTQRVELLGGRLLSPDSPFVALAGDKHLAAQWLTARGIPSPPGIRLARATDSLPAALFPAVLKPCDGAGSWHVSQVADEAQWRALVARPELRAELERGNLRLEHYIPGLAASVAVLCGPQELVALAPCQQLLAPGSMQYVGGRLPLPAPLAERARRLALDAVATLPRTTGYVGVDLVLGDADDGSGDDCIEINPRLTTSYVGLRAAAKENLAAAMVAVAMGEAVTLSFRPEPLEFRADGTLLPANARCA